ncbi:MAG: four helix bundle protein [Bacteroidota bacterium]|nr:four helix bundle protein [Bacteroidota bacterium]
MSEKKSKYDLEERTARFGEDVIRFCKKIPSGEITSPIINQLIRSSISIGANYSEADDAESKKDFKHKIGICKKESRETKHHLRMIVAAVPGISREAMILWQEAKELNLIFNAINNKLKEN